MKRSSKIIVVTLLATGVAVAAAVCAAPGYGPGGCQQGYGPGNGNGNGPMMQGGGSGPHGGSMHGRWQKGEYGPAAIEQRIERIHDQLAITAEQEPAWQTFIGQVANQRERMSAYHDAMQAQWSQGNGLTAVERMQQRAALMSERLAAMGEMTQAVETLYGQLTTEQQKQFDQMPMMMGRHQRRAF